MGQKTGDKARYNRERRKKLARRVAMRTLRKETAAAGKTEKASSGDTQ